MKSPDDFRTEEALDDAAAAWLCERDEGFAPGRAAAFTEWSERDPRHAAAVARVERALELLGEMPEVRAPLEARFGRASATSTALPVSARGGRWLQFRIPVALTAAAALVLGAVAWWSFAPRVSAGERYATNAAAQRRVALRDGSVVDLNRASDVHVEFSARERRVSLGAGEAHFQVAADAARPFVVTAGGVSVRAVGTAFNVRIAAGAVEVIVVEGEVEVVRDDASRAAAAGPRALLAAGERTQVSRVDAAVAPKVEKAEPASIRAALAWQDPMTTFNDVPLREVVMRLNQRNATQLTLEDAELGARKIGGVIALDQVEAFVRLLEQDGDVAVVRRGASEIGLRRAR
jgi:transmembrane sensor